MLKGFYFSNMVFKRSKDKRALGSNIMINLHRIEKGLTLRNVKPLFGKWFFGKLFQDLKSFEEINGSDYPQNIAISALSEYKKFHLEKNISEEKYPLNLIEKEDTRALSGTKKVEEYNSSINNSENHFFSLARSRSSIRNFSAKANLEDVKKAVALAIKTPSVCNRQPWKVHYYQNKHEIESLLKYQNGNLGFRDNIPGLIIITGNLKEMEFSYERHQIFTEGGLFSMTLIYALHSQGIGTCCLNWCSKPLNDWKAHKAAGIPQDQEIIMYLAVGMYEKDIKTTISPKKPLTDVLHVN
ncbi:nitroreductase family protein [Tamlana crocina]